MPKKMIKKKRRRRRTKKMEQTEGRTDFRSARFELEEKEKAEVGKVEF
jgi:hypothetical protein